MTEISTLEDMGLSAAEAKVYLTLLETGSTLAGPIIKKTELHRGTTYQILQRLIQKGVVSYSIQSGKRYFEATDPSRFVDVLKEKETNFRKILPALIQRKKLGEQKQEVNVYSGVKGIKTVCENILSELKNGGTYLDFGVSGLFRDIMGPYWDLWQKKKRKSKIKAKCIFDESIKKTNPKLLEDYHGTARFHSKDFSSLTDTMIYNDKVALFIWTAKPPIVVVVTNKDNANSYRNQFNLMWKQAK